MSKPVCVVWMNDAKTYEQALARADIVDRFELHCLKDDQPIPDGIASLKINEFISSSPNTSTDPRAHQWRRHKPVNL